MAASRMSRIASHRLALLLAVACAVVVQTLAQTQDSASIENTDDVEIITAPKPGSEFVAISGAESDVGVISPSDLKKHSLNNKKFQKFYPKTEADWNFKGEGKKSDVFIKDPKDFRLLRLISEGLLNPQDTLPIVSNDAITSSQINNSSKDISVNVEPEGMSGVVNDGISADSDERIIMEKKKNATKEKITKPESEASKESEEDIKVNLDANAGVQSPAFDKQKGSIAVPAQKHISLSKGKENHTNKKSTLNEASNYEVLSVKPSKEKPVADEGVFDFVDSPLSDKHLVPAGSAQAQTSRINVKKGPNGQDYEYEYIYYYYEDEGETPAQNTADKSAKANEIPVSTGTPTLRTTTPVLRISSTTPKYTKSFSDEGLGTRVKSTDVLHEEVPLTQPNREKFRYSIDNGGIVSQPVSSVPSKSSFSNEVYYQSQFNSARHPGRQAAPPVVSEQPIDTVTQPVVSSTARPISRGRTHYNVAATQDDSGAFAIAQTTPVQTKEPQARTKSSGIRQPGLELVDSNSFRTHSTSIPSNYEKAYTQYESQPRGKSIKQSSDDISITQNLPSSSGSTKSDLYQKGHTSEFVDDSARIAITTPSRAPTSISPQVTETVVDNTAPFSTLSDNSLTTVYGAGLTDKAAHDLYAIYQQTQNEETKTSSQDDRTTVVDDSDNTYFATNIPTTSIYSAPTTTTTTTTTTPAPTTTTTAATVASSPAAGRGRFRGSGALRTRHGSSTTESISGASEASRVTESTEKPRAKFQPTNRREPGAHKVSAYGRKSTTIASAEQESSTASSKDVESSKPSFVAPSRSRFRGGSVRSESGTSTESQSTSSPAAKHNFADRYNSRRRNNLRTSTTAAPSDEEGGVKQETSSSEPIAAEQQSTTFRSIRNKIQNQNSQVRPLRPGPKLNLSSRSRQSSTTTTTISTPIDADTSGSADVPVEQKHEENDDQEQVSETVVTTPSTTTTISTPPPDALTRLKNRPKLRVSDKGSHAKAQAQQSNNTAALNQNRRALVNNLLPRKKQPTPAPVEEPKEEKVESSKPITEEVEEESAPKSENDASEAAPVAEVSSTTESKLSSLIASRRRNLSARRPGTLTHASKQTANEES